MSKPTYTLTHELRILLIAVLDKHRIAFANELRSLTPNGGEVVAWMEWDIEINEGDPDSITPGQAKPDLCADGWDWKPLFTRPAPSTKPAEWQSIETAPKDPTPVDLWRGNERLVNMKRVQLSVDNIFYQPVESGYSCVRDATHWMLIPAAPQGDNK